MPFLPPCGRWKRPMASVAAVLDCCRRLRCRRSFVLQLRNVQWAVDMTLWTDSSVSYGDPYNQLSQLTKG